MAIQLREPFFLRGRRSVLLRAIWMSLALGVIGGGAGLATVLFYLLLGLMLQGSDEIDMRLIVGSAAISLATVIGIPYFRWRGESVFGIATRAGCILLIAAGPMLFENAALWGLLDLANQQLDAWKSDVEWGDMLILPVEVMFALTLLWLAWSAACFRRSWTWLLTVLVSGLSIPCWILSVTVALFSVGLVQNGLPGEVFMVLMIVFQLSIPGQFFVLLVTPWGVPFWWPPETEVPPQVEPA